MKNVETLPLEYISARRRLVSTVSPSTKPMIMGAQGDVHLAHGVAHDSEENNGPAVKHPAVEAERTYDAQNNDDGHQVVLGHLQHLGKQPQAEHLHQDHQHGGHDHGRKHAVHHIRMAGEQQRSGCTP